MVTQINDKYIGGKRRVSAYMGLSTDEKPVGQINGSLFYEMDTGDVYLYSEDSLGTGEWLKQE